MTKPNYLESLKKYIAENGKVPTALELRNFMYANTIAGTAEKANGWFIKLYKEALQQLREE